MAVDSFENAVARVRLSFSREWPEPSPEMVAALTAIVREADDTFQKVGGSSRHWVRDCFLPLLQCDGYALVQWREAASPKDQA